MDFFGVVRKRRSIRAFAYRRVEEVKLAKILGCISAAPSAGNLQAYEVYLVREAGLRQRLVKAAADQEFLAQAPIVLVFCTHAARAEARYGERGRLLYCIQDATIACTHAMLGAAALGLASVWVGKFDEAAVAQIIAAPEGQIPIAMLPIGYADEAPEVPSRRPLDDLIHKVEPPV